MAEPGGIWLPIAKQMTVPMQRLGRRVGTAMALKRQLGDLSQVYGGRAAKPKREVMLVGPDGQTPILIAGLGEAEVAEIEEIALAAAEKAEARMKQQGSPIDFERIRAEKGLPSADEFDARLREAAEDRVQRERRNPTSFTPGLAPRTPRGQSFQAIPTNPVKEQSGGSTT